MRGRDKLLEQIEGVPLLARQARMAVECGQKVLVTLPHDRPERAAALSGQAGVDTLVVPYATEGMSASLRAGAGWAQDKGAAALMVLLPDLPDLQVSDLRHVLDCFALTPDTACRGVDATGQAGHPVILPARLFGALANLTGDRGAATILQGQPVTLVPLPNTRATTDLDTPEAWARWRRGLPDN